MFNINNFKDDKKHNYLKIGSEAMIFHCHHYIAILLKTILDTKFINTKLCKQFNTK
ncbi:MAG: hypothetical protein GXO30_06560 [Epsilonproteobacteria bacterium]|nr:hypothetical protein [Campylobacterota bacterium]